MKTQLAQILAALAAGLVFGFGLSLSGMLDPARVQGFLDFFGEWDPSLAFVLGGAVAVAMGGFFVMRHMGHPLFDRTFHVPTNKRIDPPLIIGSAIFGAGWGLVGFCPGPAVASLSLGLIQSVLFVVSMLAGMMLHDRFLARMAS